MNTEWEGKRITDAIISENGWYYGETITPTEEDDLSLDDYTNMSYISEDVLITEELTNIIIKVLNTLPNREKKVIKMRKGLDGYNEMTLQQIGNIFGLTRERIRQIEAKGMRRLRHPLRANKIKEYMGYWL